MISYILRRMNLIDDGFRCIRSDGCDKDNNPLYIKYFEDKDGSGIHINTNSRDYLDYLLLYVDAFVYNQTLDDMDYANKTDGLSGKDEFYFSEIKYIKYNHELYFSEIECIKYNQLVYKPTSMKDIEVFITSIRESTVHRYNVYIYTNLSENEIEEELCYEVTFFK